MTRRIVIRRHDAAHQRGATLFVGLIMLLLLTLHAIATLHTGSTQLRIAGNAQDRRAVEAAADGVLGATIATATFADDPAAAAGGTRSIDVDGDGSADFDVALAAECRAVRPLPPVSIDGAGEDDAACISSASLNGGSLCMQTQWDVQAIAAVASGRPASGARSEIHQGVALRLPSHVALGSC